MSGVELPALEELTDHFRRLPGIGKKSAQRIAYSILEKSDESVKAFAEALLEAKRTVHPCPVCFNYCQGDICPVCADEKRDHGTVCVVEDARTVRYLASIPQLKCVFHVLGGTISPTEGRLPDSLRIAELIARVEEGNIGEVILATNPTVEGETTAMYLARRLKQYPVRVTRLAYGIPVGGEIEYADEMTLFRAIDGRKEVE